MLLTPSTFHNSSSHNSSSQKKHTHMSIFNNMVVLFGGEKQSALCEEGRDKIHNQWPFILQLGFDIKCGRSRGCTGRIDQGFKDWVANNVKKLGAELAEQLLLEWTESLV